jgi:hypothetical protein
MRFGRSWVFWAGVPLTFLFLVAGFAAAFIFIFVAIKSFQYLPIYLPLLGIVTGLIFFIFPAYAIWTLLNKSVVYVDVDDKISIRYMNGRKVTVSGVRSLYIRPSYRTIASLIIIDSTGEKEINAPYEFANYKKLFVALELACGMRIV